MQRDDVVHVHSGQRCKARTAKGYHGGDGVEHCSALVWISLVESCWPRRERGWKIPPRLAAMDDFDVQRRAKGIEGFACR
jgi:hypothetical protein